MDLHIFVLLNNQQNSTLHHFYFINYTLKLEISVFLQFLIV